VLKKTRAYWVTATTAFMYGCGALTALSSAVYLPLERSDQSGAHEQPMDAVNVLHALGRRLLPEEDSKIVGWEETNQAFGRRGRALIIRSVEASTDEEWCTPWRSRRPEFLPWREIVALTLMVNLIGSLAHLRFAPGPDTVCVPAGAKAGELLLERCHYTTEDGNYAADCGIRVVPENRADPQARLIAVPMTRIVGMAAAVGGALIGGWLGFHATERG
jgi:hypothetical protein